MIVQKNFFHGFCLNVSRMKSFNNAEDQIQEDEDDHERAISEEQA